MRRMQKNAPVIHGQVSRTEQPAARSFLIDKLQYICYNRDESNAEVVFMNTEGIIFDKDGTLLDFDAFWIKVSDVALRAFLTDIGAEPAYASEILTALGVRDGKANPNGVLCKGTYVQMGQIVYEILLNHGISQPQDQVVRLVEAAYQQNAAAGEVKPTCPDLAKVLTDLKSKGVRLAVVTTDNPQITHQCLDQLGIGMLFDRIYTDDGHTPTKPNPHCAWDFCREFGLKKENVVMVGDTLTDMSFAKNAGIMGIGLAADDPAAATLLPHADAVISAISQLPEAIP